MTTDMTILTDDLIEKGADAGLTHIEGWKPYKLAKFKKENPWPPSSPASPLHPMKED